MGRRGVFFKAILFLVLVWGVVWGVRAYAGSKKITAERVNQEIEAAAFEDRSESGGTTDARSEKITKVAKLINRLDFQEREKNRANRAGEEFFRKLSPEEKNRFVELTVMESMGKFMESLDAMPPEQRKKFVEQGLKEIENGKTGEEMARADELDKDLLDKISREGMRAYFEKSSADTKLDLAPLMESMNELMQGIRGNEFGLRQQ